nr:F-box/kelch-repeat protein At3g23880-like [Coffea arabica]
MEDADRKIRKTEEKARTKLPLVLCEKILLRLDVKALSRFKCVCNGWHDLISSSRFIRRHLDLSIADPEQNHHRVFLIFPLTTIDYRYFGFHVERKYCNKIIDKPLRYPREMSPFYLEIIGSCDGLICLLSGVKDKSIIIWNPSSQELVTSPLPFSHADLGFYWFGGDCMSDGYKLLVSSHRKYHKIYELSPYEGLYDWRKHKDEVIRPTRAFERRGTYFNGNVYWPCLQNRHIVVSYNLSNAEVRGIPAPDIIRGNASFTLGVLDGSLCAICKPYKNFEIWTMKECNLGQYYWTNLIQLEGFEANSNILRPLGTLRNGDLIVDVDQKTLQRYYFNGNTPRIVKTHNVNNGMLSDAITYVESLVSPIDSIQFSPQQLRMKNEAHG